MSEMAQTAEHLVVIGRGRLIADTSVEDFIVARLRTVVRVRAPTRPLGGSAGRAGRTLTTVGPDALDVRV